MERAISSLKNDTRLKMIAINPLLPFPLAYEIDYSKQSWISARS